MGELLLPSQRELRAALEKAARLLGAASAGVAFANDGVAFVLSEDGTVSNEAAARALLAAPPGTLFEGGPDLDGSARYLTFRSPGVDREAVVYWINPTVQLTRGVRETVGVLAGFAIGAASNAHLAIQAERRARAAEAVVSMLTTVVEPGPLDQMLHKLAIQVCEAAGAQVVAIDSYNSEGNRIDRNLHVTEDIASRQYLGDRWRELVHLRLQGPPMDPELRRMWRLPIVVPDIQNYEWTVFTPHPDELQFYALAGLRTVVACPLWAKDEFVGIMFVCDTFQRTYSREEIRSLRHMSEVVAAAIKGTQLIYDIATRARRDALTGLLNHGAIIKELHNLLQAHPDEQHAVIMADVRRMKLTNDRYGHQAGDQVLRAVAAAMSQDGVLVGRYGGDEFLAVLSGVGVSQADRYREDVRARLAEKAIEVGGTTLDISPELTMGLALYPDGATSASELVAAADADMYNLRQHQPAA